MAEREGFEPSSPGSSKSLINADLVDCELFRTSKEKQENAARGRQKQGFWQPSGNLNEIAWLSVESDIGVVSQSRDGFQGLVEWQG